MNEQALQFDFFTGRYEAVKGMELAESTDAAQLWSLKATTWLDGKPIGYEFTADDVRRDNPHGYNATGSWFNRMAKEGRIIQTGHWRKSQVVSRHANQNRIWRKVR